jgi:hypothetical protein
MHLTRAVLVPLVLLLAASGSPSGSGGEPPLPEHPRPDFERPDWINLNGDWAFRFDPEDRGRGDEWFRAETPLPLSIRVPFSWGAPLSGVPDQADVGWYARAVTVPESWAGRRAFLVVGAADWHTTAWLDGHELGTHRGGYTPFAFELTPLVRHGQPQRLVLRVDDAPHSFKLEGKQGYGKARGIWQTAYLEARGGAVLDALRLTPRLEAEAVGVEARLLEPAPLELELEVRVAADGAARPPVTRKIPAGAQRISVVDLPGTDHRYVALNGEPVYLQMALDQAYHPEGYYTFPDDAFVRDDVLRARQIGLNGLRIHVKLDPPRKLYWADRLGMLVMADVPNSWGEPTPEMRAETEHALRGMIERDYNHPSVFAWVLFNETWGLLTEKGGTREYLPETKQWVIEMVRLAKALDPTRLVEDNSVCCGRGHTETDLNSWHAYLPGYRWEEHLAEISAETRPGSQWNFEAGWRQGRQPNLNSEFGNVWGYEGSTGDVDWSWDYHLAVDAFRRHPRIAGWLYTEHHDVVNEWNGYWRYDRSSKDTGLADLADGMSLADLHAPLHVAAGTELSREVEAGSTVSVPLWASFLTGSEAWSAGFTLRAQLDGWDGLGRKRTYFETSRPVAYRPWSSEALPPLEVPMPDESALAVLVLTLEDALGHAVHRNFTTFVVNAPVPASVRLEDGRSARALRVAPAAFSDARWSLRQWDVLGGLKVNGAGAGHFEYRLPWPADVDAQTVASAVFLVEASSKPLLGKDRVEAAGISGDFMRGLGTHDPSRNPNAYPMTDERLNPSEVVVRANDVLAGRYELPDDPADHRGILSWHSQLRDGRLREAGTYGTLLRVPLPAEALARAAAAGEFVVRLEVGEALAGGLAVYGARFGRYPLDPTLLLVLGDAAP